MGWAELSIFAVQLCPGGIVYGYLEYDWYVCMIIQKYISIFIIHVYIVFH